MADTIWGIDAQTVTTFDSAYKLSFAPAVQALWAVSDFQQRRAQGLALAQQGYLIDVETMVFLADPYITQFMRQQYGLFWTPSGLQAPIENAMNGGVYSVASPQPVGSLKVSTSVADYPPFTPPAPPPAPQSQVGVDAGFEINGLEVYFNVGFTTYPEGTPSEDGKYIFHLLGNELMALSQRIGVWLRKAT